MLAWLVIAGSAVVLGGALVRILLRKDGADAAETFGFGIRWAWALSL